MPHEFSANIELKDKPNPDIPTRNGLRRRHHRRHGTVRRRLRQRHDRFLLRFHLPFQSRQHHV
ncbi:MAG: hypothetical protein U1F57_06470 [bacterium]